MKDMLKIPKRALFFLIQFFSLQILFFWLFAGVILTGMGGGGEGLYVTYLSFFSIPFIFFIHKKRLASNIVLFFAIAIFYFLFRDYVGPFSVDLLSLSTIALLVLSIVSSVLWFV